MPPSTAMAAASSALVVVPVPATGLMAPTWPANSMSLPSPPISQSSSLPPTRMSLPAPPRTSLPRSPAKTMSSPSPASMTAATLTWKVEPVGAAPSIVRPAVFWTVSLLTPLRRSMVSAPAVPVMVSLSAASMVSPTVSMTLPSPSTDVNQRFPASSSKASWRFVGGAALPSTAPEGSLIWSRNMFQPPAQSVEARLFRPRSMARAKVTDQPAVNVVSGSAAIIASMTSLFCWYWE